MASILNAIPVKRADVAAIVSATFPDYRGRKIKVLATESETIHDLNWSGGSRSEYRSCTLRGQYIGGADRYNQQAPWANQGEGKSVPIPPGAVLVRHSIFCGKDVGLTIYVNPADMPKLLPAT
jgi:hypothetical protein